ncbi:hypothetical protein HPB49_004671 [Dermacentor silvarum]|uniref:Uncharacterized protein n=1 Tax=Dermacentor silvarum TaxID=543639 RepID=A0ACB8C245_DERSI|nr:hypothetical protein HPB49_004671 [Dermacentor silvarum]
MAILDAVSGDQKKKDVAAKFGIPASSLSTILNAKDAIRSAVARGTDGKKKLQSSTYADVDTAVFAWFMDMRARDVPISGAILQQKARDYACILGCDDLKGSNGWLEGFKRRYGIVGKVISGESSSADSNGADSWIQPTPSRSHYHVSIRQVYECENKLRLQSTLPTVATSRSVNEEDEQWQDLDGNANSLRPKCNVVVTEETLTKMKDIIPVLVYVAGYAVYAALKKLKCQKCREALTLNKAISVSVADKHYDLIRAMDRGGLVHPTMFVVNAVAHNYAVVEQLSKQEVFLKLSNQRQVVTDLTVELLNNDESSDFDACDD